MRFPKQYSGNTLRFDALLCERGCAKKISSNKTRRRRRKTRLENAINNLLILYANLWYFSIRFRHQQFTTINIFCIRKQCGSDSKSNISSDMEYHKFVCQFLLCFSSMNNIPCITTTDVWKQYIDYTMFIIETWESRVLCCKKHKQVFPSSFSRLRTMYGISQPKLWRKTLNFIPIHSYNFRW